jgi:membrane peptidoglycan carboxypeptidase
MSRWMMALIFLFGLTFVGAGVMAGVGYGVYRTYANDLIPPDEAIAQLPRGGARIYDRNGQELFEFLDNGEGLRQPVSIDRMNLYLIAATISWEDTSFEDNPGINYKGLTAAAIDNFWPFGGSSGVLEGRGGSSITQQLVKNVYFTQEEREKRTIDRKLRETVYALELTRKYDKRQIMEWYLNQISYGNIYYGAQAASQGYFGKDAIDLTLAEAALLAGIPQCPTCFDPVNEPEAAVAQRNRVLVRMHEECECLTADQTFYAALEPMQLVKQDYPIEAPHFVFSLIKPELQEMFGPDSVTDDGLVVYTSLDLELQRKAEGILEEQISTYEASSGGHNGAVVAMDPRTAQILAYVGSRDYANEDITGQNDMAVALNSPGSTLKPFTYTTAFMNLGWGPGTMILDTPINTKWWDGANPPRNPGTGYQGPITVRDSLGSSLNIPAIKTILYTGVSPVIDQARKMGITSLGDPTQYGPSLTVGGVDVKLLDVVYGYSVFPNNGLLKGVPRTAQDDVPGSRELDPVTILRVEDRDGKVLYPLVDGQPAQEVPAQEIRVAPAENAFMINDILSDGCAQRITFGACGALSIPGRKLAIKTGTSEPYETVGLIGDTWAFGYTPQLVVGSWFGNADNTPMTNISSTSVSWRTVRDFAIAFHENLPVEEFARPEGLVRGTVCMPSGLKTTPGCGKTTPEDWFATASFPQRDDDWWVSGRIDTRTGRPATDNTPQQFVATARTLRIPEGLSEWAREQAQEWASVLGRRPTTGPDGENGDQSVPVGITSPESAAPVDGLVIVRGSANSENFQFFRLEFQPSGSDSWALIAQTGQPVDNGTLGVWDTSDLTPGIYTLRLTVVDTGAGEISTRIDVLVLAPGDTDDTEPTPEEDGGGGGRGNGRGPPDD